MTKKSELTPQQKAVDVALSLQQGKQMTTAEIAEQYGMTWHGANKMLNTMSGVAPIHKEGGRWSKVE